MRLLTTLYETKNIKTLSPYVDGFIVGNDTFGTRLTTSFDVDQINQAISEVKSLDKEIFLQSNQMMDDDLLDQFSLFLDSLDTHDLDGIVVADIGAVMLLKTKGILNKAIYNPETLLTNHYDFNFLENQDVYGAYIAKEITLEDIKEISDHKQIKLFMTGHGHLNMFYSKRQLIHNFMDFSDEENVYHNKQNLKIVEEKRSEDPYPILEDKAGTHVFRSHVFTALYDLEFLDPLVDYMVIDTLFKDDDYASKVCQLFSQKQVDENQVADLKETYDDVWDDGFFHKKTIYKAKVE